MNNEIKKRIKRGKSIVFNKRKIYIAKIYIRRILK